MLRPPALLSKAGYAPAPPSPRPIRWVKSGREQGKGTFAFLELNDGSVPMNLQARA